MNRKQRVVLVANDVGGVGGMEKHLEEMIQRMKHDYDVVVVSSTLRISDRQGIRFVRIPAVRRPFPLMTLMFSTYASLRVKLMSRNAIVHTTGAILLCRADVSTIHFCHAGWLKAVGSDDTGASLFRQINHRIGMKMKLWMELLAYIPKRTRFLVPVSQRVRQELGEFYPYPHSQIRVIANGVDVDTFHPASLAEKHQLRASLDLPVAGVYIIFMGGDWERKGVRYVLEAFNELAPHYPELHALIVGSGDGSRFLNHFNSAYSARVHFVGKQANPEVWYRLSDIFVFPSNYEACSLAVLEAAASGLAMVVTNVGGAEEVIEEGYTGHFVERSAESIRDKLKLLLDEPAEIQRMGTEVRRSVESMTWDATYQQFSHLYRFIESEKNSNRVEKSALSRT